MTSDTGTSASREQSGAVPAGTSRWRTIALVATSVFVVGLVAVSVLLWNRTSELQDTVRALQHPTAASASRGPGKTAPANAAAITRLTTCVNTYMKTIGTWSANVNSRYNYRFC